MTGTIADPTPEMVCRELVELVTDYLEDTLTPLDRERFEAHLAECDGCLAYLNQMRTTIALTGRLADVAVPADIQRDLLTTLREWKRQG